MNKVRVEFEYDETAKLWEVYVYGVVDSQEAKFAFSAVWHTMQLCQPGRHHKTEKQFGSFDNYNSRYKMIIGVSSPCRRLI